MINIPDLGEEFLEMWQQLLLLAQQPPAPWTLIGAHRSGSSGRQDLRQRTRMAQASPRVCRPGFRMLRRRTKPGGCSHYLSATDESVSSCRAITGRFRRRAGRLSRPAGQACPSS